MWYMEREGQLRKDTVHYVLAFVFVFFPPQSCQISAESVLEVQNET